MIRGARGDDGTADFDRLTAAVLDALHSLGGVSARPLGRLRGLFHLASGDVPFGVVCRGHVFFKTGPDTVTRYIARSMRPLRLDSARQPLRGYWRVPPEVLDDPRELSAWATRAVDAARQFGRRRPAKLKRPRRVDAQTRRPLTPGVTASSTGRANQ